MSVMLHVILLDPEVFNNIGQVSSSSTERRFDVEFESAIGAVMAYGVPNANPVLRDLACQTLPDS